LLFCNKQISEEAAKVCYRKNLFVFEGDHNWDPIVSWLSKIRDRNRRILSKLNISAYRPEEVWQCPNGERRDPTREPMYPRSPYLQFRTPLKYGVVENINPAGETIFQLLGQKTSTHRPSLDCKLRDGEYPGEGIFLQEDDQYSQHRWCSMDLPNLVENFRTLYSPLLDDSYSSQPLIEVIWTGKCPRVKVEREYKKYSRTTIQDHLENIKDRGWEIEILPMEGEYWGWRPYDQEDKNIPNFVLRRKPLEEPLEGNDPNPWLWGSLMFTPEDEEYKPEKINHYYS
jgi:hypothetical protein